MRRSARRHHQDQQQYRHSTYDLSSNNGKSQDKPDMNDRTLRELDVSHDALQSLLNSKFKLIDLIDLLKKIYPKLLLNDQKRELHFFQQLSQTNTGKR
jgi:hypothetical protein